MPLTAKGEKILHNMEGTYGSEKKAEEVLYASKNAGTVTGIDCDADRIMRDHISGGATEAQARELAHGEFGMPVSEQPVADCAGSYVAPVSMDKCPSGHPIHGDGH